MIDTRKYEGHTPGPWNITVSVFKGKYILEEAKDPTDANEVCVNADLMQDAPLLLQEVKRLRKALHIEEQIVQAFYEYVQDCCFDHCEAWMLEKGHRVMVRYGNQGQSEWKVEVE